MAVTAVKKLTLEVPTDLLEKAQKQTGEGITETIRQALRLLAESSSYESLKKYKGKAKFAMTWEELKEDRE